MRSVWTAGVVAALWAAGLAGQSAKVAGRVLDSTEGSISGAAVTLTRTETGDRREVLTNGEGYYSFPLLIPGTYEIKAERPGFQTATRTGIRVETGTSLTVDLVLPVGEVTQSVSVEGAGVPLLQTASAAVAQVVENKTIVNMPLIDRRSAQLTRLSGFVVQAGAGSGATFAIAGGRGNNSNYYIDGGTAQNLNLGVPTLVFDPPVESMEEFHVAVSNYAAELGRTGGGVIQMTTKSGTNAFHGSVYEYLRNDVLNARSFFAKTIPPLRYNLFGTSLGGPVRKDKTHFFFNYEGRRQVTAATQTLNLPDVAEVKGDFSGDSYRVLDPLTKVPFAGNVIPASRLDPVGAKLAALYPAPNVAGASSGKANFIVNDPSRTVADVYVGRVDHVIGEKDRVFGRFLGQTDHTQTESVYPTPGTDTFGVLSHNYYYNVSGTWIHNLTPAAINEARYTYTRRQALSISAGANTALADQVGIKGTNAAFFPTVTVTGFQAIGNTSQQQRLQTPIRSDQYADSVSLQRGKHQLKMGFEYRYSSNLDRYSPTAGGSFGFNNVATGSGLASLLLGWVNTASLLETYPLLSRSDSYDAFIQDDWRVAPRLTLNLGLRYDLDQPRWETNNRQNSFDRAAINPVSGTAGVITFSGRGGLSRYASSWDKNNFGPRVGFAWQPANGWVIRGGGAVLYTGEYDQATPVVANTGFSKQGSFASPDNGVTAAFLLVNGMPPTAAPGEGDLTRGFGAVKVGEKPTTAVSFFEPHRSNGYLYQASLDIQRELRGGILVDLGYLGTFGHHLAAPDAQSINQVAPGDLRAGNAQVKRPFPQFTNVSVIAADIGKSNYHGLNVGVEKRYSNGLLFKANYTLAKMIDNVASRNELAGYPGTGAFTDYYNQGSQRGLSGNDIRHRFIWSSVYELPVGQGKKIHPGSRVVNGIAGGWSLGFIAELRTGTPLSVIELTNNTNSFSDGVRPNVAGDWRIAGDRTKADQLAQWFNVNAFAAPAAYTFGNAGRSFGQGPGAANLDLSILKDFRVGERTVVQFRAEGLNFLNHANFANPDTRRGSPTFGQITSLVSGNQSRLVQFGLHVRF